MYSVADAVSSPLYGKRLAIRQIGVRSGPCARRNGGASRPIRLRDIFSSNGRLEE